MVLIFGVTFLFFVFLHRLLDLDPCGSLTRTLKASHCAKTCLNLGIKPGLSWLEPMQPCSTRTAFVYIGLAQKPVQLQNLVPHK